MNFLVTGGAGFIGSHIVDQLVNQGHNVLVVDDLSRGRIMNVNPQAKLLKMDLRDQALQKTIPDHKIDYVFHTAAQVDVQASLHQPTHDASVNILGTINLLEGCRRGGVKKVIYSSSAAIYGEPQYLPVDEGHPLNPCSGYGISKMVPERYLAMFWELYGVGYTVLRYSNVYGPRQDSTGEGGVVAIFCSQMLRGETPQIFGDGQQTRDFIYVDDVASANLAAIDAGLTQICNISTGKATSIIDLFQTVANIVGKEIRPHYQPAKTGDILHSYLSPINAAEHLGWSSKIDIQEGLYRTMQSMMQTSQ